MESLLPLMEICPQVCVDRSLSLYICKQQFSSFLSRTNQSQSDCIKTASRQLSPTSLTQKPQVKFDLFAACFVGLSKKLVPQSNSDFTVF